MDFDPRRFDQYREDDRREVKQAAGGLPGSLWETYSAFANGDGGVILIGLVERADGSWKTTGLKKEDARKLVEHFWDSINNPNKVSVNLLKEKDVEVFEIGDDVVFAIHVPAAERQNKPVYLNKDPFGQTYRRNFEGDYHCSKAQVRAMFRDQEENTMDMGILEDCPMEYLNLETVRGYRNRHRSFKSGRPFERLSYDEFLRSVGAAAISQKDGLLHPTGAGLLMFGDEYNIVRYFPEYFLDYRETLDPTIRWIDRVHSSSGEWSGNVCDFYFRVYNKIIKEVKVPFKVVGGIRIDDTPVHRALREALANCLTNADFYGTCGVVVKLEDRRLILENPGYIRVGKKQALLGGKSDPRNKGLMRMFNLIDIGERAGRGVPDIYATWADNGFDAPEIKEEFNPDRTTLILPLDDRRWSSDSPARAIGSSSDKTEQKQAIKTSDKPDSASPSDNVKPRKTLSETASDFSTSEKNDEKKRRNNTSKTSDKLGAASPSDNVKPRKTPSETASDFSTSEKNDEKKRRNNTSKTSDKLGAASSSDNAKPRKTPSKADTERPVNEIKRRKQAIKTLEHAERIVAYLRNAGEANNATISRALGLSPSRTRAILSAMPEIVGIGMNRNRVYRLKTEG